MSKKIGPFRIRVVKQPIKQLREGQAVIELTDHAEGVVLPVRAQPGARKNGVTGQHDGALKIAVTAPPEDGRANKAIVDVLCKALGLKRAQVELLSGHTSRQKRFLIRGMAVAELQRHLEQLVG